MTIEDRIRRASAADVAFRSLKAGGARVELRQTDPREARFLHGPAYITGTPLPPLDAGGVFGEDGGFIATLSGQRGWGRSRDEALACLRRRLDPEGHLRFPPVTRKDPTHA